MAQNALRAEVEQAMAAMAAAPDDIECKRRFIAVSGELAVEGAEPEIAAALEACLATPGLDCAWVDVLWANVLVRDPAFAPLLKHVTRARPFWLWRNPFASVHDFSPLLTPYFLSGLRALVVSNEVFELFLTRLRSFLLLDRKAGGLGEENYVRLASALAVYCENTGYIFDCTLREAAALARMMGRADAPAVAITACYISLHKLPNVAAVERLYADHESLGSVVAQQIAAPRRLALRMEGVEALTAVDDPVSLMVRGMYEESPYPRWRELNEAKFPVWPRDAKVLEKEGAQALVAGCGTGRESAHLAALYPKADILAIDITRASLAYAGAKAEEYGLARLQHRQADILKLPQVLTAQYDYVHCVGVLHHMDDPLAGWRVLADLVKPGGTMFIGLYGEVPRRSIVAARAAIARGKYPATDAGMRAFRKACPRLIAPEHMATLRIALDYYYLPMYRDLLFHVQEHRFTLPGIRAALAELGLVFEGFKLPDTVLAEFAKDCSDPCDLVAWEAFEKRYPDTFIHSYKFWCRKA